MTTVDVKGLTCTVCGREGTRGFEFPEDGAGPMCRNQDQCNSRVAANQRKANVGRCCDCVAEGVTTARKPALDRTGGSRPGNRCVTHWRAHKRSQSLKAHANRVSRDSDFTGEHYWALYAWQDGRCFGCRKATGKTKRLAVDHDHELAEQHDHPPDRWCLQCVRALLCGPCNQTIGRLGVEALCRLIVVLTNPPARRFFAAS